jgi:hypothetical protein
MGAAEIAFAAPVVAWRGAVGTPLVLMGGALCAVAAKLLFAG